MENLQEQYGLDYPELIQISNEPETGFIRLIGYVADYPLYKEKKWHLFAETIYINPATGKVYRIESTTSKNKDWVISNGYKVILTSGGIPVLNPDFVTEESVQVEIGNDEEGNPIFETQLVPKGISMENSPYILTNAFDLYYGIRHNKDLNMSMSTLFELSVKADDMWGYFDNKEAHYDVLDVVNSIYANN